MGIKKYSLFLNSSLGMTATPRRTENIDTYKYFGEPVFTYSLGQGIDDGFLATYKVHRTITNFTEDGLVIQDAIAQGAQLEVPPEAEPQDQYEMPDFESKIKMPEHVATLCAHMDGLMRRFGRMEKTMVFCVSMEHALLVTEELNRLNSDLNIPDYAVRIVSEEGAVGKAMLEKFQDTEKLVPVIATTVDLLTTGVDAPSVRNVVFMKPMSSIVSFKQIVGRGSRLCADIDKFWFRVIDYTKASRLFDDWDRPTEPPEGGPATEAPFTCIIGGRVISQNNGYPISGARVFLQVGSNQILDQLTGQDGQFFFSGVGQGKTILTVTALKHNRIQMTLTTHPSTPIAKEILLKPQIEKPKSLIKITGLDVQMVDETYEERDSEGNLVTPEDYLIKVRNEILLVCQSIEELHASWINKTNRCDFMELLEDRKVDIEILREILRSPGIDSYDILAHVAFDADLHSCEQRANAFLNLHMQFFESFDVEARNVLHILLEKYRYGGLEEADNPKVFGLSPFNSDVRKIAQAFGGSAELRAAIDNMIALIYLDEII